jgi:molybdate transport system ATP-binding protein
VRVAGHDDADGLTRLAFAGGVMTVPAVALPVGEELRIRVRARDVALALEVPSGISILNIFAGRVMEIAEAGPAQMDILLDIAGQESAEPCRLWARITRRSARELALEPGKPIHALIKAVAIDRHSLGQ